MVAENCLAKRAKQTSARRAKLNVFENIYNAMRACEPPEPSALAARFCTPLNAAWERIPLIISCTHPTSCALTLPRVDRGAAGGDVADKGPPARVLPFAAATADAIRDP